MLQTDKCVEGGGGPVAPKSSHHVRQTCCPDYVSHINILPIKPIPPSVRDMSLLPQRDFILQKRSLVCLPCRL